MKPSRKYLEHTADILFQAEAETLPELFEQCAMAVEESQVDVENFGVSEKVTITGENKKIDLLLFDFLDDLLMYKDSELLIFSKFDIKIEEKVVESEESGAGDGNNGTSVQETEVSGHRNEVPSVPEPSDEGAEKAGEGKKTYYLYCTAYGEKIDAEKHERKVDVKAITMHMFEVKKVHGGWQAQVLLDI